MHFSVDESQKDNDAWKKQVTEKYIPDDFSYVRFKNMQNWTICKSIYVYGKLEKKR